MTNTICHELMNVIGFNCDILQEDYQPGDHRRGEL